MCSRWASGSGCQVDAALTSSQFLMPVWPSAESSGSGSVAARRSASTRCQPPAARARRQAARRLDCWSEAHAVSALDALAKARLAVVVDEEKVSEAPLAPPDQPEGHAEPLHHSRGLDPGCRLRAAARWG